MAVNSFNAQNPPVTTKGDVFTFSTIPTRLGVGANDTVLTADSTAATGLKWATPAVTKTMSLITSGNLSGNAQITISSLSAYDELVFYFANATWPTGTSTLELRINGTTTNTYRRSGHYWRETQSPARIDGLQNRLDMCTGDCENTSGSNTGIVTLTNCKNAGFTNWRNTSAYRWTGTTNVAIENTQGVFENSVAVSSIVFTNQNGYTFNGGTYRVYGA